MLTTPEKIVFIVMTLIFVGLTFAGFYRIYRVIRRGRPSTPRKNLPVKAFAALAEIGMQKPMYKARPLLSTFHAFIFFGFSYYLLVNVNDLLEGFIPGYSTAEISEFPLGILNLLGDLLTVGVLFGMLMFILRRLRGADQRLYFNDNIYLNDKVKKGGIKRDSFIVGAFIMFHVGSRFMGQVFRLAEMGISNPMQPFASLVSKAFVGLSPETLNFGVHAFWWVAIGLVVVFLPYFIPSKHAHLIGSLLNLITYRQDPRGRLEPAVPAGSDNGYAPGAATLEDLAWPRLLDPYACIMCSRCQDVCPAYTTGRPLSPAALEINKRYYLNQNLGALSGGAAVASPLLEMALPSEAVWACTTCYACVQVCPVGNEPMADIVDIRRHMIMEAPGELDSGIQSTLETIAKTGNSFGQSARKRARWTKDLDFEVKDLSEGKAEYLWFLGDYASFDPRVVPYTQRVAQIFHKAGIDFGILGKAEKNAGNDVRRVGEEGLFEMLVEDNVAAMGQTEFDKIVTTDPHSLNTLRNEYPQYGGMWPVEHYTGLLVKLIESGKIKLVEKLSGYTVTYHDPCYLGRYNGGFDAPRKLLQLTGVDATEMPRNKENSFCCGAGGGQIWVGTTPDGERPAENRIREALDTLPDNGKQRLFVVACPKDVVMYTDAVKASGNEGKIEVVDIIELVAEAMGESAMMQEAAASAEA